MVQGVKHIRFLISVLLCAAWCCPVFATCDPGMSIKIKPVLFITKNSQPQVLNQYTFSIVGSSEIGDDYFSADKICLWRDNAIDQMAYWAPGADSLMLYRCNQDTAGLVINLGVNFYNNLTGDRCMLDAGDYEISSVLVEGLSLDVLTGGEMSGVYAISSEDYESSTDGFIILFSVEIIMDRLVSNVYVPDTLSVCANTFPYELNLGDYQYPDKVSYWTTTWKKYNTGSSTWETLETRILLGPETANTFAFEEPGKYTFVSSIMLNGSFCQATDTFDIIAIDTPDVSIPGTQYLCRNGTAELAVTPSGAFVSYIWQDAYGHCLSRYDSLLVADTGIYTVIVTDTNTCYSRNAVAVEIKNTEVLAFTEPVIHECFTLPNTVTLEPGSSDFSSFRWSTGDTTSSILVSQPGDYRISVTDEEGCVSSALVSVADTCSRRTIDNVPSHAWIAELSKSLFDDADSNQLRVVDPRSISGDMEYGEDDLVKYNAWVRLQYHRTGHSDYLDSIWMLVVPYSITIDDDITETGTLILKKSAAQQDVYEAVNTHTGGARLDLDIDEENIEVFDRNGDEQDLDFLPDDINLELDMRITHIPAIVSGSSGTMLGESQISVSTDNINKKIQVAWDPLKEALDYELEVAFADAYDTDQSINESFFKDKGWSIVTAENFYILDATFPDGTLAYRIRPRSRQLEGVDSNYSHVKYGKWSDIKTITIAPTGGEGDLIAFEPEKNWSKVVTFAEEGKKKEVVSYMDDALRTQQALTNLNSEKLTLAAETYYDHESRPVLNVLPVPLQDNNLLYKQNLATVSGSPLSKDMFDQGVQPVLDDYNVSAAQYYSVNNPYKSLPAYSDKLPIANIPQAGGYVTTKVDYTRDNTGRVLRQSGVGGEFSLDTSGQKHYTQYFYATPTQSELQRLFGSNAGLAVFYTKEMTVDPNGQVSLRYKNNSERIIATALSGDSPANLLSLDRPEPASFTRDLSMNNIRDSLNYLSASTNIILNDKINKAYTFRYSPSVGVNEGEYCKACVYQLEIFITDPTGNYVNLSGESNTLPEYMEYVQDGDGNDIKITGVLVVDKCSDTAYEYETLELNVSFDKIGDYTFTKILTLQKGTAGLAEYEDALEQLNFPTLEEFLEEHIGNYIDTLACRNDCQGLLEVYLRDLKKQDELNGYVFDPEHYNAVRDSLESSGWCDPFKAAVNDSSEYARRYCESIFQNMVRQISPGEKYFSSKTYPAIANALSPERDSLIAWGIYLAGNNSSAALEARWEFDWGEKVARLFKSSIHPEYCHYEQCLDDTIYAGFDHKLTLISGFREAVDSGYITATGTAESNNRSYDYGPRLINEIARISGLASILDTFIVFRNPSTGDVFGDINAIDAVRPRFVLTVTGSYDYDVSKIYYQDSLQYDVNNNSVIGTAEWDSIFWMRLVSNLLTSKKRALNSIHAAMMPACPYLDDEEAIVKNPVMGSEEAEAYVQTYQTQEFYCSACRGSAEMQYNILVASCPALHAVADDEVRDEIISRLENYCLSVCGPENPLGIITSQAIAGGDLDEIIEYIEGLGEDIDTCSIADLLDSHFDYHYAQDSIGDSVVVYMCDTVACSVESMIDVANQYNFMYPPVDSLLFREGFDSGVSTLFYADWIYLDTSRNNGRILNRNVARNILDNYTLIPLYEDYYRHMTTYFDATGDSLGYYLSHGTEDDDGFDSVCWGTTEPIQVEAGRQYLLSYYLANSSFDNIDIRPVILATDTAYVDTLITIPDTLACILGWNRYNFYWTAPYGVDSVHIRLHNEETNSWGNDFMIDEIRFEQATQPPLPDIHCSGFRYHKFYADPGEISAAYLQCDSSSYNGGLHTLFFVDSGANHITDIEYLDGRKYVAVSPVSPTPEYAYRNIRYQHLQYTAHRAGGQTKTVFVYMASCAMPDWDFVNDNGDNGVAAIIAALQLSNANTTYLDDNDNYACDRDYDTCVLKPHYVVDTIFGYPLDSIMADYQPDTSFQACIDRQKEAAAGLLTSLYMDSLSQIITQIDQEQIQNCFATLQEVFSVTSLYDEYHYTLYYYDQAGNLIQTVPPAGVYPLPDTAFDDMGKWDGTEPGHALKTIYQYNSRNQPLYQVTPDGGETRYWYNKKGQPILTQNAKQKPHFQFSFTQYDPLGRIILVGEVRTSPDFDTLSALADPDFPLDPAFGLSDSITDLTQTVYDIPVTIPGLTQENLRNKVSATYVFTNYANMQERKGIATVYSYDAVGNVKTVVQDLSLDPELIALEQNADAEHLKKRVDYLYDLISGKVNKVFYNRSKPDQFMHRYEYDADNRITDVYTSTDGIIEHRDAKYFYYPHGPLARVEFGDYQVQSLDYTYTLQGWLKSINGIGNEDKGIDYFFANKQFISTLGYYQNDYKAIFDYSAYPPGNDEFAAFAPFYISQADARYKGLYNGNIIYSVTDLYGLLKDSAMYGDSEDNWYYGNKTLLGMQYQYDQLNRILYADGRTPRLNNMNQDYGVSSYYRNTGDPRDYYDNQNVYDAYKSRYHYDANGNITALDRYAPDVVNHRFALMDSMVYSYATHAFTGKMFNNRLYHVNDFQTDAFRFLSDIDDLGEYTPDMEVTNPDLQYFGSNYAYDPSGNLIQDISSGIVNIGWNPYGKIENIDFEIKPDLKFKYDAAGNRVAKIIRKKDESADSLVTYYFRDAQGNPLDIIKPLRYTNESEEEIYSEVHEYNIYGSSRLGIYRDTIYVNTPPALTYGNFTRFSGKREYELTNHLGNVMTTLTDQKYFHQRPGPVESSSFYYEPVVTTVTDYYPFGMPMPGRSGFSQERHCFEYDTIYAENFTTCTDDNEEDKYIRNYWYNEFPKKPVDSLYLRPWGTIEWDETEKMHMYGLETELSGDVPDVVAARNAVVESGSRYILSTEIPDMEDSMMVVLAVLNEDTVRLTGSFERAVLGLNTSTSAGNISCDFIANTDNVLLFINALSFGDPRAGSDLKVDRVILAKLDSIPTDTIITIVDSIFTEDTVFAEAIYTSDFQEGLDNWTAQFPFADFFYYTNPFYIQSGQLSIEENRLTIRHLFSYIFEQDDASYGYMARDYEVDSGQAYRFSTDTGWVYLMDQPRELLVFDTKKLRQWVTNPAEGEPGIIGGYLYPVNTNSPGFSDFIARGDSITVVVFFLCDPEDTASAWGRLDNALLQLRDSLDPEVLTPVVTYDFSTDPVDTFYNSYIQYDTDTPEQEGILNWNDVAEELELSYLPGTYNDSAMTSAITSFTTEKWQRYVISYDIGGPASFTFRTFVTRNNLVHDSLQTYEIYSRDHTSPGHREDTVWASRDTMSVLIRIRMEDTTDIYTIDNFEVNKLEEYVLGDTVEFENFDSSIGSWRSRIFMPDSLSATFGPNESGKLTWLPELPAIRFAPRKTYFAGAEEYPYIGYLNHYVEVDSGALYRARIHVKDYSDNIMQAIWLAIQGDTVARYSFTGLDKALGTDIEAEPDTSFTLWFRAPATEDVMLLLALVATDTPAYVIIDSASLDRMDTVEGYTYIRDTVVEYAYIYDTVLLQEFETDITPWRNYLLEADTLPYHPGILECDATGQRLKVTQDNFHVPIDGLPDTVWAGAAGVDLRVEPGKKYRIRYRMEKSGNIDSTQSFGNLSVVKTSTLAENGLFWAQNLYEQQNILDGDFVSGIFAGPLDDTLMTATIAILGFKDLQAEAGYFYIDDFVLEEATEVECNDTLTLLADGNSYRFGFNGMEKDDEVKGDGGHLQFGDYGYDPRIGRRWNVDPKVYPWQSGYSVFNNCPIFFSDPLGLEGGESITLNSTNNTDEIRSTVTTIEPEYQQIKNTNDPSFKKGLENISDGKALSRRSDKNTSDITNATVVKTTTTTTETVMKIVYDNTGKQILETITQTKTVSSVTDIYFYNNTGYYDDLLYSTRIDNSPPVPTNVKSPVVSTSMQIFRDVAVYHRNLTGLSFNAYNAFETDLKVYNTTVDHQTPLRFAKSLVRDVIKKGAFEGKTQFIPKGTVMQTPFMIFYISSLTGRGQTNKERIANDLPNGIGIKEYYIDPKRLDFHGYKK